MTSAQQPERWARLRVRARETGKRPAGRLQPLPEIRQGICVSRETECPDERRAGDRVVRRGGETGPVSSVVDSGGRDAVCTNLVQLSAHVDLSTLVDSRQTDRLGVPVKCSPCPAKRIPDPANREGVPAGGASHRGDKPAYRANGRFGRMGSPQHPANCLSLRAESPRHPANGDVDRANSHSRPAKSSPDRTWGNSHPVPGDPDRASVGFVSVQNVSATLKIRSARAAGDSDRGGNRAIPGSNGHDRLFHARRDLEPDIRNPIGESRQPVRQFGRKRNPIRWLDPHCDTRDRGAACTGSPPIRPQARALGETRVHPVSKTRGSEAPEREVVS